MAKDPSVASLKRVLTELKAIQLRINRQIAFIQKALRPISSSRSKSAVRVKRTSQTSTLPKRTRSRAVGFVRDRQILSKKLSKKPRK